MAQKSLSGQSLNAEPSGQRSAQERRSIDYPFSAIALELMVCLSAGRSPYPHPLKLPQLGVSYVL